MRRINLLKILGCAVKDVFWGDGGLVGGIVYAAVPRWPNGRSRAPFCETPAGRVLVSEGES